jgi:hypothetical protein
LDVALKSICTEQVVNAGKDQVNADVKEQHHREECRPGHGEQAIITGNSQQPSLVRLNHVE